MDSSSNLFDIDTFLKHTSDEIDCGFMSNGIQIVFGSSSNDIPEMSNKRI